MKRKLSNWIAIMLLALTFVSCKEDDDIYQPVFAAIEITPQKDVYEVGDEIVCTIRRTNPGQGDLRVAQYWWYASWWFTDSEMKADFEDFDENNVCTSEPITLTQPGQVALYFFGRLEYPNWDYRKVEIGKTITVVAKN